MSEKRKTIGIYTLGCKVNQYESEAIAERCEKLGLLCRAPDDTCDAYIINTCTVTGEAERKARQFIRRAIKQNPRARIIVTGCASQVNPDDISSIPGVDAVCGNTDKLAAADTAVSLLRNDEKRGIPDITVDDIDIAAFEPMTISSFGRTRACVKIEDGCESRCTYCIIPAARGKIRSKLPAEVVSELRGLIAGGCREVVLTGIETASYGQDLGNTDLASLLTEIDKIEGICRVRLGSLDPSLIKPEFVRKIVELKSLAPHFHLSVQSASDRVLALMKRKYNSNMLRRAVTLLRDEIPGVQLTADMIVGFPQETDADFQASADFIREAELLSVHVFAYSQRKGTPAAVMQGQIPEPLKRERSASLIQTAAKTRQRVLDRIVSDEPHHTVLFETYRNGYAYGHTPSFIEVCVKSPVPLDDRLCDVALSGHNGQVCFGILTDRNHADA